MDTPLSAALLETAQLRVSVPGRVLIDGLDCAVRAGEFIALLGGNGTGKSLLLRTLAGLREPAAGSVLLGGRNIQTLARREVATRLGFLPQDPDAAPQGLLTETVALGRFAHLGFLEMASSSDSQRVLQALADVGLAALAQRELGTLSGGEQRRAAIARLLVQAPSIYLLDEPTNHLDFEMRHSLITALQDFAGAVIVVSHDRGLLRSVCDQFWLVADGRVVDFEGDLEDYSNWLEKRGSTASTPAAPKPRGEDKRAQRRKDGDPRKDLAPKRQEIKSVETSLDKLGQERARLEKDLAGLDYTRDPAHARKVTERHAALIREIEQLETRWLELSERLESLNG